MPLTDATPAIAIPIMTVRQMAAFAEIEARCHDREGGNADSYGGASAHLFARYLLYCPIKPGFLNSFERKGQRERSEESERSQKKTQMLNVPINRCCRVAQHEYEQTNE
ncbi:hypothetical protein ACC691_16705 [Rhizobium johnstonii]|uniref:hypothetical protein n=1 Tax=Rhizobium johnstonii TaxID=3019933 RepID=UPI003F988EC9